MTATTLSAPANTRQDAADSRPLNGRWTRTRAVVRHWFARSQLGPIENYVTR